MRQKRAKAYRKLMAQYERAFGFRQPYQVLVNADFCELAVQLKMDLLKELETVVQAKAKPMITQCCIAALYALGAPGQRIVDLAKTFERRRCGHLETPLAPDECVAAVVGPANRHRYVVAAQSEALRRRMRDTPGVPTVALNRAVMVLESISERSREKMRAMEEETLAAPREEVKALRPALKAAKAAAEGEKPPAAPVVRKKKPKGPNPLSVQKKKNPVLRPGVGPALREAGDDGVVRLGKRAREEEEGEGEGEDGGHGGRGEEERAAEKKKRKRRRKNNIEEGVQGTLREVGAADGDDSED